MIYKARISPDLEMNYRIDDFTDPWQEADAILMLHGNAESGAVWFGWVPHLARHFRVVRPDMRGFGDSTPMPLDFQWSPDRIVDDYVELMRSLNIRRFHLVGVFGGGVFAIAPGDHIEHQSCVAHRERHRAGGVLAVAEGHNARAANQA